MHLAAQQQQADTTALAGGLAALLLVSGGLAAAAAQNNNEEASSEPIPPATSVSDVTASVSDFAVAAVSAPALSTTANVAATDVSNEEEKSAAPAKVEGKSEAEVAAAYDRARLEQLEIDR